MKLALGDFPDGVLVIPDGVTTINNNAFSGDYSGGTDKYRSIKSIIIPNSVTSIGSGSFKYCTGLTSITIPNSVTSIGDSAFYNCTSLTSITIPDGVTSIKPSTFRDCTSLKIVTIPDSVTSIGSQAFHYSISYSSDIPLNIYYKGTEEQWNAITKGDQWNSYYSYNASQTYTRTTYITYNYVPEE